MTKSSLRNSLEKVKFMPTCILFHFLCPRGEHINTTVCTPESKTVVITRLIFKHNVGWRAGGELRCEPNTEASLPESLEQTWMNKLLSDNTFKQKCSQAWKDLKRHTTERTEWTLKHIFQRRRQSILAFHTHEALDEHKSHF